MPDVENTHVLKAIKFNRWILWITLVSIGVLTFSVMDIGPTEPLPGTVPAGGDGPGPIYSGKIKKPGSAGNDYTLIIERGTINAGMAGDPWLLHEDLMNRDIDQFDAKYAHASGSGTYAISSTTIKIDNDRDGTFEPGDGEIELQVSRSSSCAAGTCLVWKDLTSGNEFSPCSDGEGGAYDACKESGIPPQFFGYPVTDGWTVIKLNAIDPDPNASGDPVEKVNVYLN